MVAPVGLKGRGLQGLQQQHILEYFHGVPRLVTQQVRTLLNRSFTNPFSQTSLSWFWVIAQLRGIYASIKQA